MPRSVVVSALLAAALASVGATTASAQSCTGSQPAVCPLGTPSGASDCVISAPCNVASGEPYPTIDFGTRRLVIHRPVTVTGAGILRVVAGGFLMTTNGRINAFGEGMGMQSIDLDTPGAFAMESGAVLDVSSAKGTLQVPGSGGSIVIRAGTVNIAGRLSSTGDTRDTYGGAIDVISDGDLRVDKLEVKGGDRAGGGDVSLYAGGSITATGWIKAQGAEGGTVSFDAVGDVVVLGAATIEVQANGPDGGGGSVDTFAGGSATFWSVVTGTGLEGQREDGPAGTGGDGADFSVETIEGAITINARVDLDGAPSGSGGDLELDAGTDVNIGGTIRIGANGKLGTGSVGTTVRAGRDLVIANDINAIGAAGGGELAFSAGRTLQVTGAGRVRVDGVNSQGLGTAGFATLDGACSVDIQAGAILSAKGLGSFPYGTIDLRADHLRIAGRLESAVANVLVYRTVEVLGTAAFVPAAPVPPPNPEAAPCCGGCATTTTTTLPPPTTTTSTTLPPPTTTTTTLPPPTTTTSTTLPPPTTTSTTLPPPTTTTSTTLPPPTTTTTTQPPATTTTTLPPPTTTTTTLPPPTTTTSTTLPPPTTTAPTTTSTTSSTEPSTSTTLVTTTTSVSSTSLATSTSTTVEPSTTSTTVPPGGECGAEESAFDAADCHIGALAEALRATSSEVLGGKATAKRLTGFLTRATRFLTSAESGKKVQLNLRRARKELKNFEKTVRKGLTRKRGPIDPEVGEAILELVRAASGDVGVAQATSPRSG